MNDANKCEWFSSSQCRFFAVRLRRKIIQFDLNDANECEWFSCIDILKISNFPTKSEKNYKSLRQYSRYEPGNYFKSWKLYENQKCSKYDILYINFHQNLMRNPNLKKSIQNLNLEKSYSTFSDIMYRAPIHKMTETRA